MNKETADGPDTASGPSLATRDRVIAGVILAAAAVFWYASGDIPLAEARFFPRMILAGIAGLSLFLLLRGPRPSDHETAVPIVAVPSAFAVFVAASIVYAAAVSYLGYFTTTVVFVPGVALALGLRRPVVIIATTAAFLTFVYLVFVTLFNRPLPPEFFAG